MSSASSSSSHLAHAGLRRHEFSTEHLVSDFTLRNACVLYRTSSHRKKLQFVSLDGTTAIIHGFSEYRFGFIRLATVRTPTGLAEERTLRGECKWNKLALAIPFTANNLYHALFHAVPAFESLTQHSNGNNVSFVPLLSNSAGVGRKLSSTDGAWRAWELLVRAFTLDSSSTIASSLDDLLWREPCMCFERVHGSSAPFTPSAPSSAPRIRAWRSVVLHNVGSGAVPLSPTILYIRRSRTRVLLNEAELTRSLALTSAIDLAALPLSEQLIRIANARGLIGVHGQALALIPFLAANLKPSDKAAVLEVLPPPVDGDKCNGRACETNPFKHTYEELSQAMGNVLHLTVTGRLAPPCEARSLRLKLEMRLKCNLTVAPARFAMKVARLRSFIGLT